MNNLTQYTLVPRKNSFILKSLTFFNRPVKTFLHDEEAPKTILDDIFQIQKDAVARNSILCHCHAPSLLDRYMSQGFQQIRVFGKDRIEVLARLIKKVNKFNADGIFASDNRDNRENTDFLRGTTTNRIDKFNIVRKI